MATAKRTGKRAGGKSGAKRGGTGKGAAKEATARKATAKKAGTKKAAKAKAGKGRSPARRPTAPPPPPLPAEEKRAIVSRYIAAYNARDTAAILALYDPKATMEDPVGLPPAVGHAAIADLYKMGFDMGVTIASDGAIRLAGPAVAFPLIASSPTSKLQVIDVFEFGHGGRIIAMKAYWGPDNLEGDLAVRQ